MKTFVFFAEFEPGPMFTGLEISLDVGPFKLLLRHAQGAAEFDGNYERSFDEEIRDPANRAFHSVALAQTLETKRPISFRLTNWIEVIGAHAASVLGFYAVIPSMPVSNQDFLSKFVAAVPNSAVIYAEPSLRYAISDFDRALSAPFDESIYHLHHSLENAKSYFGSWPKLRSKLGIAEAQLRKVTDFSSHMVRHGGHWTELEKMSDEDRSKKRGELFGVSENALRRFVDYLVKQR